MSNPNDPQGTIPVELAYEWAANWRDYLEKSGQAFAIRSFLVPIVDFQNILLYNPNAESVRAYIGLETADDPMAANLMLVPVVDGQDVPLVPVSETDGGGQLRGVTQSNIYDQSLPCPPCGNPVPGGMNP
jgi:hypothetical protein